MDADKSQRYYLAAAAQCPLPDQNIGDLINVVAMDFFMVQFCNNYRGVAKFVLGAAAQNTFNVAQWDDWADTTSPNRGVKVLLDVAANTRAANAGVYIPASALKPVIEYSKTFGSFGGVMMWDMSQM